MVDRDPEVIKAEIESTRTQLAATVDTLADRANPRRIADDAKSKAVAFVNQPAVKLTVAGVVALVLLLAIRRVRTRRMLRSSLV